MRLRCQKALVVFISVRPYRKSDLDQLLQVYKSAFAEPPWNEYLKCSNCGVEYGRYEAANEKCKKCEKPLHMIEFWSNSDIIADLEFALNQPNPIVLVAELGSELAGMSWGYKIPFDKFPFLKGKIPAESSYMDEIAVRGDRRRIGIGKALGRAFIEASKNLSEVVLRTDERNPASIALFKRLGFSAIPDPKNPRGLVYDQQYPNRIYLRSEVAK